MIFLYILLTVLLIIFISLLFPFGVDILIDKKINLTIRYGIIKFPINLEKIEKAKAEEKGTATAEKGKTKVVKSKSENPVTKLFRNETFVDAIIELCDIAKDFLSQFAKLLRRVYAKKFKLDIVVSDSDAAQTAIKFGQVCAAVYPLRGIAEGLIKFKQDDVNITSDFENGQNSINLEASLRIIPIFALASLFKVLFRIIKFIRINKKDGANNE